MLLRAALASLLVASLVTPALAEKEFKVGTSGGYVLKPRRAVTPNGDSETGTPKAVVTDRQVDDKVRDRFDEIEYCWLRVPAGKRITTTVTLHLSIEGDGLVSAAKTIGELPVGVDACITGTAERWRFPVTGNKSELDHTFNFSAK